MVVNEESKSVDVVEVAFFLCISIFDVVHRLVASKNVLNCIIHWIIEDSSEVVLVWANICWVSIEAFSHLEHASSLTILAPEILWHLWNSINSYPIKAKILDKF